ncbi:hypothetical protein ACH4ZX_37395 [Streptomyces sp. NPDC020490]|uniref:hypothetical protein n=1 Tax=Streptomyces sp. NPDC020490 TaxID=3365078 RepID=UPI0037954AD3
MRFLKAGSSCLLDDEDGDGDAVPDRPPDSIVPRCPGGRMRPPGTAARLAQVPGIAQLA